MSDEIVVEGKGVRVPTLVRPPVQDEADAMAREVCQRTQCDMFQARAALDIAHWDVERAVENLQAVLAEASKHSIREDFEMLFRCGMQFMRYLAKKYGFTIKQWPEK